MRQRKRFAWLVLVAVLSVVVIPVGWVVIEYLRFASQYVTEPSRDLGDGIQVRFHEGGYLVTRGSTVLFPGDPRRQSLDGVAIAHGSKGAELLVGSLDPPQFWVLDLSRSWRPVLIFETRRAFDDYLHGVGVETIPELAPPSDFVGGTR